MGQKVKKEKEIEKNEVEYEGLDEEKMKLYGEQTEILKNGVEQLKEIG